MELDLSGTRALVGGASRGIGRACAFELAGLGASVTAVARSTEDLEKLVRELPADAGQEHDFFAADYDDPASLQREVEDRAKARPYRTLIHNTGGPAGGKAIDAEPEAFIASMRRHLASGQVLARALVPGMRDLGEGRIINIVSTSVYEPIANLGVSNATRAAIAGWAKTLADELGPDGITVNNVLPGFTATGRLDTILSTRAEREGKSIEQVTKDIQATIPARRFATPEEVGAAAAFLASRSAAYISGVSLPVDGGRLRSI